MSQYGSTMSWFCPHAEQGRSVLGVPGWMKESGVTGLGIGGRWFRVRLFEPCRVVDASLGLGTVLVAEPAGPVGGASGVAVGADPDPVHVVHGGGAGAVFLWHVGHDVSAFLKKGAGFFVVPVNCQR